MSIAYIANSTGVPADYILAHFQATLRAAEAGAPPPTAIQELPEDTIYKPLDILGEDLHLPGGPKALEDAINAAVDAYETEEAP
ncbi:MAG: hypothetical protein R2867_29120 [Caldilineaceae bacterium]